MSRQPKLSDKGMAVAVLALTSVLYVASCGHQHPTSPTAIKVGVVLPLTGDSAAWGEQGRDGAQLALEELNSAGGVKGKRIEAIYEDSKADPKAAVSAIQKLTSLDKVPAIVGDITSAATLAMAPVAERAHVVLIAPSASAPAISGAGKFIFRVWPSDTLEGSAIAQYAAQAGFKRAAVLYIQTDYGTGLRDVFAAKFRSRGGTVALSEGYNKDETDFKPLLLKVVMAKPDAIYVVGYYKDTALVLKQARDVGLRSQFFGATAVESPDLLTIAGPAAEGLIYPTINDFDPSHPNAAAKAFISTFTKRFGKAPDWAASHTHDALLVVGEAMRAGGPTGPDIQRAIDTSRRFEGVTGHIVFDDNGDVLDKPVVIKTVKNGHFTVLKPSL